MGNKKNTDIYNINNLKAILWPLNNKLEYAEAFFKEILFQRV